MKHAVCFTLTNCQDWKTVFWESLGNVSGLNLQTLKKFVGSGSCACSHSSKKMQIAGIGFVLLIVFQFRMRRLGSSYAFISHVWEGGLRSLRLLEHAVECMLLFSVLSRGDPILIKLGAYHQIRSTAFPRERESEGWPHQMYSVFCLWRFPIFLSLWNFGPFGFSWLPWLINKCTYSILFLREAWSDGRTAGMFISPFFRTGAIFLEISWWL